MNALDYRRRRFAALHAGARHHHDQEWLQIVRQAAHIVSQTHVNLADPSPVVYNVRLPNRVIPGDHIPLSAEDILSLEAELTGAMEQAIEYREIANKQREVLVAGYQASLAMTDQELFDLEHLAVLTPNEQPRPEEIFGALRALIAEVRGYRKAARL